jgi:CheY-like chemotaxis protein
MGIPASPSDPRTGTRTRRRVLIVEDDADTRGLFAELLSRSGFMVEEATNGQEALAVVKTFEPDVIVMDLRLPEVDGASAAKAIRASPVTKDIPIVAVTGADDLRTPAYMAGIDAFLPKPCDPDVLLRVLEDMLRSEPAASEKA